MTILPIPAAQIDELSRDPKSAIRTLMPAAEAQGAADAIERSLELRPTPREAAISAAQLAGLYPQQAHDHETYLEGLRRTFLRYPPDLGERAVDEVSSESDYLPTRAALTRKLEALVGERRDMIRRAKAHLARHEEIERRRREEADRLTPEQIARINREVQETHGKRSVDEQFPSK